MLFSLSSAFVNCGFEGSGCIFAKGFVVLSTFYLIWDLLAHLSSVFSSRRTSEISVRCLVTERCLRMRINTLFIRCLSTEPVFECLTRNMNGAAWGYTTFSSVFREFWSPRHLNTRIKAIKRLCRALRDDYVKPSRHMLIFFFCLNFRHVPLQLYMRQVYRSIYFTIFSSLLDVWNVRAGIREKLVTVLYSRQSDRICYFFLFPTEYRVVLHCGKSELGARGRRRLPFKPIIISMHMVAYCERLLLMHLSTGAWTGASFWKELIF